MTIGIGYPLAFVAMALAISSAQANDFPRLQDGELRIPRWLVPLFLVLLGSASFAVGILNPETMALVGMEGVTAP
jgi:hypothetical protein